MKQKLTFPGKTFVLGEYAVLEIGSALLLGHGPYFSAEIHSGGTPAAPFHPQSPAGRWLEQHPFSGSISFADPHGGRGGFGGSGAEFLSAWCAGRELPGEAATLRERSRIAWQAWDDSRSFPGSGADILTQAFGLNDPSPFFLAVDIRPRILEELRPAHLGATLSLFHTGKKLATHSALAQKPALPLLRLAELVERGCEALRSSSLRELAAAVAGYGEALAEAGLVAPHTAEALRSLPRASVLAAKGCGAMGADVLLVLHQGADLAAWARQNSLAEAVSLPL